MRIGMTAKTLNNFYRWIIESILSTALLPGTAAAAELIVRPSKGCWRQWSASSSGQLVMPRVWSKQGGMAFSHYAVHCWNQLPT